jgi:D-glycero-alpha-D-manno-heptose 1-phosphate guanylyltransferase
MPLQTEQGLTAVLLVGGMGTRLRSVVPSAPKPMAVVGDKSFLELLVRQLQDQGVRHLVFCTGYLADQIEQHFGGGQAWGVEIQYSRERQPLGTAGAVKLAQSCLRNASEFLVMNGDSFMETDVHNLLRFHRERGALATLAVRRVESASRYGTVQLDSNGRVTAFLEKQGEERSGLVNAGVYIFTQEALDHIPEGPSSLEKDVFPKLLERGVFALEQHGMFIDIGTPEDYARAQQLCDRLYSAAAPRK